MNKAILFTFLVILFVPSLSVCMNEESGTQMVTLNVQPEAPPVEPPAETSLTTESWARTLKNVGKLSATMLATGCLFIGAIGISTDARNLTNAAIPLEIHTTYAFPFNLELAQNADNYKLGIHCLPIRYPRSRKRDLPLLKEIAS